MPGVREEQEISVLGRLCTLEVLILFMGFVTMVYGIVSGNWSRAGLGTLVFGGALALLLFSWRWCTSDSPQESKQE